MTLSSELRTWSYDIGLYTLPRSAHAPCTKGLLPLTEKESEHPPPLQRCGKWAIIFENFLQEAL